jgi:hypothetical protein
MVLNNPASSSTQVTGLGDTMKDVSNSDGKQDATWKLSEIGLGHEFRGITPEMFERARSGFPKQKHKLRTQNKRNKKAPLNYPVLLRTHHRKEGQHSNSRGPRHSS